MCDAEASAIFVLQQRYSAEAHQSSYAAGTVRLNGRLAHLNTV